MEPQKTQKDAEESMFSVFPRLLRPNKSAPRLNKKEIS